MIAEIGVFVIVVYSVVFDSSTLRNTVYQINTFKCSGCNNFND